MRYGLCKDGTYYNSDKCSTCMNNCKNCFDENTCLSCPDGFYITTDNKCLECSVIPGCLKCTDKDTCDLCKKDDHWKETPN
jgi:proprotein convertase subtilisin/kexin type 5